MPMQVDLIATSTMGLEAVVARELADLGYPSRIVEVGRIAFQADERAICRTNLWLRTAGRVLIQAGSFPAADFGELFDRTYALPWDRWIAPNAAFPVAGRSLKSQLSSVPACQRIVKKAVAEKLIAAHGAARLEETGPPCQIEVSVLKDVATLTLDTSGSGLHKPGIPRLSARPAQEDPCRGACATKLLETRPAAGRPLLRDGHDPNRGRADRPQPRAGFESVFCGGGLADAGSVALASRSRRSPRPGTSELARADPRHGPRR